MRPAFAHHVEGYRPLAFAPPYGNYGQAGTNDPRIPRALLERLLLSFAVVFTQDRSGFAKAGDGKLKREIPGGVHRETPARSGTSLELEILRRGGTGWRVTDPSLTSFSSAIAPIMPGLNRGVRCGGCAGRAGFSAGLSPGVSAG